MKKRILCFLAAGLFFCLCLCGSLLPAAAYDRQQHDSDLEYILFGQRDYRKTHPRATDKIVALEDAAFLCVDQYNGTGAAELSNLRSRNVSGLPGSVREIDFTSNYSHRKHTHMGWEHEYKDQEEVSWETRKSILLNTADKELFSAVKSPFSWIPWLPETKKYEKQRDAFCALVYYTHLIDDHLSVKEEAEANPLKTLREKTNGLAYLSPLSRSEDQTDPGIIPDLIKYCGILFESQSSTSRYISFIQDLEALGDRSERLYYSVGGIDSEEKLREYGKCAEDLLELLAANVPELLRKEKFFAASFYK